MTMYSEFRIGDLGRSAPGQDQVHVAVLSPEICITNRDAIIAELALDVSCPFEDLIRAAWKRWNEAMAARLRGTFAFVIADHARNVIYAARDHFGLAPLFWHEAGRNVSFATSSTRLRQELTHALPHDALMLTDFIAGEYVERERSFFEGINRFPAAHWVVFSTAGKRLERYWSMSDVPRAVQHNDPVARFRELFDRSVLASVPQGDAAIMLSGGLDSSAIAASLCQMGKPPGQAFSVTFDETAGWCDQPHLQAVANRTGLPIHAIPADSHDPLQDMELWLRAVDGPYLPRGQSVSMQLLPIARETGYRTLFNGHGGDEIVGYGFGRYNELARAGNWFRLWRETEAAASLYGGSRNAMFARYLAHIRPLRPILRRLAKRQASSPAVVDADFLDPAVARTVDSARYTHRPATSRLDHDERIVQEEALSTALQPCSLEIFALCSRAAGVVTRMPFYDVDLLEFSLSLPSEWKLRDGLSRYILRAAFAGDLPSETLRRQDKFDFTAPFMKGLVAQREKVLDLTDPAHADPWHIVNRSRLERSRDSLCRDGTGASRADAAFLWRVAILAMWSEIAKDRRHDSVPIGKHEAKGVQV